MAEQEYTQYEIARILGARALQISMDAPLLVAFDDNELEEVNYDPLKIAEIEFEEGALPITVHRPKPKRKEGRLQTVKEEHIDDEKIIAKEKEVEEEISEKAEEMGFASEDDSDESFGDSGSGEED